MVKQTEKEKEKKEKHVHVCLFKILKYRSFFCLARIMAVKKDEEQCQLWLSK